MPVTFTSLALALVLVLLGGGTAAVAGWTWLGRVARLHDFSAWPSGIVRARPLVEALYRWERRHGSFPERLAQLVPSELPSIPASIVGAPEWRYERSPDGRGFVLGFATPDGYPACGYYERYCVSRVGCDAAALHGAELAVAEARAFHEEHGAFVEAPAELGPGGAWLGRFEFPDGIELRNGAHALRHGWCCDM